jgi:hypothetical protein
MGKRKGVVIKAIPTPPKRVRGNNEKTVPFDEAYQAISHGDEYHYGHKGYDPESRLVVKLHSRYLEVAGEYGHRWDPFYDLPASAIPEVFTEDAIKEIKETTIKRSKAIIEAHRTVIEDLLKQIKAAEDIIAKREAQLVLLEE